MIQGRQITLHRPQKSGTDAFNAEVIEWEDEVIDDVLIEPLSTSDLSDTLRPNGDSVTAKLHLPKTYTKDTRGCECSFGGARYKVKGAPIAYQVENTPTRWNYPIEVERIDG